MDNEDKTKSLANADTDPKGSKPGEDTFDYNQELPAPPDVQNFRSMKFDIADAAKQKDVSLSEIAIAAQRGKKHGFEWEDEQAKRERNQKWLTASIVIVFIAIIVIFGNQLLLTISERSSQNDNDVSTIVMVDDQIGLNLDEPVGNTSFFDSLSVLHSTLVAQRGDIIQVYFTINPGEDDPDQDQILVAPIERVVEALDVNMPPLLSRTIDRTRYVYGWYAVDADRFEPYFIARVINEDSATAALRGWESTMEHDLVDIFFLTKSSKGRLFINTRAGAFNVRELKDQYGDTMLVYLVRDSKLVIATDIDIALELVDHLETTLPE